MSVAGQCLELEAIELRRGDRTLVAGLSFTLEPGRLALITGPNGSGKTTLLRAVAGLSPPASGRICISGCEVQRLEAAERSQIAYNGHLEGLKKDLTVQENIQFINDLKNKSDLKNKVMNELALNAIAGRSVRNLSAGQKRRVALACLRLSGARLWLLDEPLTNLDASGRELIRSWLDQHLAGGGMAMVATHLADDLKRPGCLLVEL